MHLNKKFFVIWLLFVAACSTAPENASKPPVGGVSLIERTSGVVCRGKAAIPNGNDTADIEISFDAPDRYARGVATFNAGNASAFDECQIDRDQVTLACVAAAGPVAIPLTFQFSPDMSEVKGAFGSYFNANSDIQFNAICQSNNSN